MCTPFIEPPSALAEVGALGNALYPSWETWTGDTAHKDILVNHMVEAIKDVAPLR